MSFNHKMQNVLTNLRAVTNDYFGIRVIYWLFWQRSNVIFSYKNIKVEKTGFNMTIYMKTNNEAIIICSNKLSKPSNHMVLLTTLLKHNVIWLYEHNLSTLCIITDTPRGRQRPGDVSLYSVIKRSLNTSL